MQRIIMQNACNRIRNVFKQKRRTLKPHPGVHHYSLGIYHAYLVQLVAVGRYRRPEAVALEFNDFDFSLQFYRLWQKMKSKMWTNVLLVFMWQMQESF